jgi:hypothetical protein
MIVHSPDLVLPNEIAFCGHSFSDDETVQKLLLETDKLHSLGFN